MPPGWGTYDYEYKCKDSRGVFFWYQMFSCSWHLFSFLLAIYLSSFVGHSLLVIFIHDQYGRATRYFKCFRERFTLHTFVVFLVSSGALSESNSNSSLGGISSKICPIFAGVLPTKTIYAPILLKSIRKYLSLKTCII